MKTSNDIIFSGSVPGSLTSDPYELTNMVVFGITAALSGGASPVGSIKLQASCDKATNGVPTTWVDITSPVTSVQAISADGNVMWNYANAGYKWVRVVYTRTSGSCTMVITANVKGF